MGNPAEKTTGHPTRVMNTEVMSVLASEIFVKSFYILQWSPGVLALLILATVAVCIKKSNELRVQKIRVLQQRQPRHSSERPSHKIYLN